MKNINIYKNTIKAFLFMCILTAPVCTFAASYVVSPMVIDHEMEKRDIVTEKITITNKGDALIQIFPTVNEVSVNEGGNIKDFLEPSMVENRGTAVTSWLEISRAQIELKPNETRDITLTIHVNPEVESGEYHALIGFPEGGNRPEAEKQVRAGSAPGTIVRIGVDKVQNQFLRLEKFSVERFVKKTAEGEITISLKNPGEDPVIPKGEIIFYDNGGTEIGTLPINEVATPIAAGAEITLQQEIPEDMKLGKYKALLRVEYGEHQTASLNDTAFFYVLPLKQIIIIFVVVLLFAIIIALVIHRRYDTNVHDDGTSNVVMYIRENRSESKDHDIDLSKKN